MAQWVYSDLRSSKLVSGDGARWAISGFLHHAPYCECSAYLGSSGVLTWGVPGHLGGDILLAVGSPQDTLRAAGSSRDRVQVAGSPRDRLRAAGGPQAAGGRGDSCHRRAGEHWGTTWGLPKAQPGAQAPGDRGREKSAIIVCAIHGPLAKTHDAGPRWLCAPESSLAQTHKPEPSSQDGQRDISAWSIKTITDLKRDPAQGRSW